jgi:hypothetical protein
MSAVAAVQAAGHDKCYGIDSIAPAPSASSGQVLAKKLKDTAPTVSEWEEKPQKR